ERLALSAAEWRVNSRTMMPGRERVFVVRFCRCLDKPTRRLVLQKEKPRALEKAVKLATIIYFSVPDIMQLALVDNPESVSLVRFPNPRGVYNNYTGTWFKLEGVANLLSY
ncbi:hypothetical protein PHMEG_00022392, partial [Phytophthora megakarya]